MFYQSCPHLLLNFCRSDWFQSFLGNVLGLHSYDSIYFLGVVRIYKYDI